MPHRPSGPFGSTLIQDASFEQQKILGEQQRSRVDEAAANVARNQGEGMGHSQSDGWAVSSNSQNEGRELIRISARGHYLYVHQQEWVDKAEYERRMKLVGFVIPEKTDKPNEIMTRLTRDGVVSPFALPGLMERVKIKEFFKRYRKWRRRCESVSYHEYTAQIEAITGWRCGADFWLFRLLGFGPRPR